MFNFFRKKKEDVKLFYHTDVHCHILPGVDHGAKNIQNGIELLKADMDMGIDRVILTSHVTSETFENTPETLQTAFETFKEAVKEAGLDVEMHLSAEYRMDDYWQKEYAAGHIIPMPGNYILLENSFVQELIGSDQMMFDLMCKGYKPILAHPERYPYWAHNRERYEKMHNTNLKFQINILSFTGYFGSSARDTANWLVKNGMVDMLGSDMHNLEHAEIIKDFLRSKEWRKISEKLQGHIINDEVI
ncbi:MAG: hypothetical protein KBT32_07410 [Bacteroidales bacterium]|nr:hypothetical protein [Candidatus Physcocola equi]